MKYIKKESSPEDSKASLQLVKQEAVIKSEVDFSAGYSIEGDAYGETESPISEDTMAFYNNSQCKGMRKVKKEKNQFKCGRYLSITVPKLRILCPRIVKKENYHLITVHHWSDETFTMQA